MAVVGTTANNMPELPEVETIKNILKELTEGKTITTVDVLRKQTIDGDASDFAKELKNQTIKSFERIGKFIIFHLTNNLVMVSHLRMEGKYFLKNENEPLNKHDLVVFHFKSGDKLVYNDTRKFGRMCLKTEDTYKLEPPLSNVGPDPFMLDNASILEKAFKNKSIAIKTALLDQSIMSGLGNIYVDEVLFETKVHPLTPAKAVSKSKLEEILKSAKVILKNACNAGGTTIKSYHPREGISGNFQVELKAYGKKDKCCPRCGTPFKKIFVNGRGTTFCPHCQKSPIKKLVVGLTGPIASGKSTVAKIIEKLGFARVDCDEIVHQLYENKMVLNHLKNIIPDLEIKNKVIDRNSLKTILINNPESKKELEKYIFELVKKEVTKAIDNTNKSVVIEAPLIFEAKLDSLCDEVVYVDANEETQIRNLNARHEDVDSSLKLNKTFNKENIKKATIVITNNDDVASLENKINSIFCK